MNDNVICKQKQFYSFLPHLFSLLFLSVLVHLLGLSVRCCREWWHDHPCLAPDVRERTTFSPSDMTFTKGFCRIFSSWQSSPLFTLCLEILFWMRVGFCQYFSPSIDRVMLMFSSFAHNIVGYINWFSNAGPALHTWEVCCHSVVEHNYFYVLLSWFC